MRISAQCFEGMLPSLKASLAYLDLSVSIYLQGPEAESSRQMQTAGSQCCCIEMSAVSPCV